MTDLAEMIVHLARLGQAGAPRAQAVPLTAAQWTALRYFSRANRFSRTPSAFSDFHATTRGTASQTVKSLVALGLLARQNHATDGRSTLLDVTEAGHAQLRADPLRDLRRVLDTLPPETAAEVAKALRQSIDHLAHLREAPVFGTCYDCGHCAVADQRPAFCQCTQSELTAQDMQEICVDFAPRSAAQGGRS